MTAMRFAILAGAVLLVVPMSAEAQVAYNRPATRGAYGGGLIEMLVTGGGGTVQAASPGLNAFYEPAQPRSARRYAGLPADPDAGLIGRGPNPEYQRQTVSYDGPEAPGTIVVDTPSKFLYHVQPGGRAMRYGIGVGRPGFSWSGIKTVSMKREWPDWTPPSEMLKRRPDLPRHMEGGPGNPLGARALYLGSSLYRIHGTNEPHTIGQNVSSGCIRMMNEDVIDLYGKVGVGTRVKVI